MHIRMLLGVMFVGSLVGAANGQAKHAETSQAKQQAGDKDPRAVTLPVTRVSLYKNGVGFFEHTGNVTGNQRVAIDLTTDQLNDVLQSLTALDLNGGRIAGAGYNSTTPLEQQLKALPLGLGEDPSSANFYEAIKGARVSVSGPGGGMTGRLLSMEIRTMPAKDGAEGAGVEKRFITVVSDSGEVRSIELTSATVVRLLDIDLHTDVTRYLELLASSRNQGLRHLTLQANGTGTRGLVVSYISEVPVWKSTYRILFTDAIGAGTGKKTATLQGWSVVDNTTGTDWLNVHLSLIAGAPQSFIQPLSVPYYSRRPEIGLPEEAQLAPQTHESGDATDVPAGPPPPMAAMKSRGMYGSAAGMGIGRISENQTVNVSASGTGGGAMHVGGRADLAIYEDIAQQSFTPQATGAAFDDYFEYKLTDPITIRKNESALVPILQTKIDAERVTLWSANQPQQALRALWVTNTSDLTLDRGSFSIVENNSFGGEGLLDPIHPKERRLLSYAVDQAVKVTADSTTDVRRVVHISVSKGVYKQSATEIADAEYKVRNAAPEPRLVVVETPVRGGFTLDSTPKPDETTSALYRFKVNVAPGQTERLHVRQKRTDLRIYSLVNGNIESQFNVLVTDGRNHPEIESQLEPIFAAKRRLVEIDTQITATQAKFDELSKDQARTRENLTALKGSKEERDLARKYTTLMSQQEDQLGTLRKQIDDLKLQRAGAQADLDKLLQNLTIEADL